MDTIEKYKKDRENVRYSLNEEIRKAQREKNKETEEEEEKLEKEDILLTESNNILADYIYLLEHK